MQNKDEALNEAKEQLVMEINNWLKSKQSDATAKPVVFEDVESQTETADMKRGNSVRVFIYVDKTDIILIRGLNAIVLSEDEKEIEPEQPPNTPEKTSLQLVYEAKTMEEVKIVFVELKKKNIITYSTFPTENTPEKCYLLFYTQTGDIKGVVSMDEKKILRDTQTNKEIKGDYFDGFKAYWFILKN
jgi:hypothetical protein